MREFFFTFSKEKLLHKRLTLFLKTCEQEVGSKNEQTSCVITFGANCGILLLAN